MFVLCMHKRYLAKLCRINFRDFYEGINPGNVMGMDFLRDPRINKGLGFTVEERQALGIQGFQPARVKTQEEQVELCRVTVDQYKDPINKYVYLSDLQERNERLFYRLLTENIEDLMPIVCTPTVGLVCQKYGIVYRRARGLFITSNDRGYIFNVLNNWPEPHVRVIVVTDGERILGLGDLGAYGIGISVGKLVLCTALAGIKPHHCLPIQLDCGTNNVELLEDPNYIGLRQHRIDGKEYDNFIDEFMYAVLKRYGEHTLIQFEDFGFNNASRMLDKYRNEFCIFNNDIQGTGAIVLAGLIASNRLTGKNIADHTFVFAGAGGAATGIANICVAAMHAEGISPDEARSKICMVDVDGLLTTDRNDELNKYQKLYAKEHEPMSNLLDVVQKFNPSILIGVSGTSGIFTPEILQHMAEQHKRPIIFALSNPNNKAECTPEQAYQHTSGQVIYASGSPFPPIEYNGKTYTTGQGNNAYIFTGLALGVIATQSHHIPDEMFLVAAKELANAVCIEDLELGSVFPPLSGIREVSMRIAIAVAQYAYDNKYASVHPEKKNKRRWLEQQLYNFHYTSALPTTWRYPPPSYMKIESKADE